MEEQKIESIIENEREWRRFVVEKVESIEKQMHINTAWALVFRVIGGAMFALILALIEFKK